MTMGFRVGEVTQNTAIVWTRITRDAERNWEDLLNGGELQPHEAKLLVPLGAFEGTVLRPGRRGE